MKTLFIGSKDLGVEILRQMIDIDRSNIVGAITIDDRSDSRTAFSKFFELCDLEGVPLTVAANRSDAESRIRTLEPDLCLVVGWYWLIGEDVLRVAGNGFIGLHFSLLPKYRGSSPLVWTVINGESEAGFSFFSLTEGMDEGPVWTQGSVPIGPRDYISDVLDNLTSKAIEAFGRMYPKILTGKLSPSEQSTAEATYCSPRFPIDGEIDWSKSAEQIFNFVRAQSRPYPGAFTYLGEDRITVWTVRQDSSSRYFGTPGQIARIEHSGVWVICGNDKAIVLESIELNGRTQRASEIIRSVKSRLPRMAGLRG